MPPAPCALPALVADRPAARRAIRPRPPMAALRAVSDRPCRSPGGGKSAASGCTMPPTFAGAPPVFAERPTPPSRPAEGAVNPYRDIRHRASAPTAPRSLPGPGSGPGPGPGSAPAASPVHAPAQTRFPRDAAVTVGAVGWRELGEVARLQERAFRPSLAYGLATLAILRFLPNVRFVVARRGRELLGCAIGDRQGRQARVINLAVDPDVRRRGIGAALLAALEAALPGGDVILMVEADNPAAQALYRAAGYAAVGQSADYYGRGRAGIWMQKSRTVSDARLPALRL